MKQRGSNRRRGGAKRIAADRCGRTGKVAFFSWASANHVGSRLPDYERSYRCTECGLWHITSYTKADHERRQVEQQVKTRNRMAMTDPEYMTPADFVMKITWEGGIIDALDYGLKHTDLDPTDPESKQIRDAWRDLENTYNKLTGPVTRVREAMEPFNPE